MFVKNGLVAEIAKGWNDLLPLVKIKFNVIIDPKV